MNNSLVLEGVKRSWGDFSLDLSLECIGSEYLVVLGPSGAGKSSLLRLIAGFEQLDHGRIYLGAKDISKMRPEDRGIGMLFQDLALFPHYNVAGNVGYGLRVKGIRGKAYERRISEVLDSLGLCGFETRKVHTLSGGEAQRVALARALAPNPKILLLDEALSSLDAPLRRRLSKDLATVIKASHTLCIAVSHDQREALDTADRIILMRKGRIVEIGSTEKFRRREFSNPFSRNFILKEDGE